MEVDIRSSWAHSLLPSCTFSCTSMTSFPYPLILKQIVSSSQLSPCFLFFLSLFFPWAFAPPLLISFLSAPSSSFPPCSFFLVLSPFLQIRGLMITRGGSYQVLTVHQALGSALASHHLIWASLPPCEVGTVIIIPTLQTSNWSQGKLGNLPKDTQLCIGDPIPTDITSAVLFPLFHIGAKRREWRD